MRPAKARVRHWKRFDRLVLGVLLVAVVSGCSSGRVGGVQVFVDGLVVSDALSTAPSAICSQGEVRKVPGKPVPAVRITHWVVLAEPRKELLYLRTSPMRSEQRLPGVSVTRTLRVADLRSGRVARLDNPLDNDDDQIERLLLDGERLYAEVTGRYKVPPIPKRPRYFVCALDTQAWSPISAEAGAAFFPRYSVAQPYVDARDPAGRSDSAATSEPARPPAAAWRGVETFDEWQRRGLNRGSWGELREERRNGQWEVRYVSADGRMVRVFRENTLTGLTESALDLTGLSADEPAP